MTYPGSPASKPQSQKSNPHSLAPKTLLWAKVLHHPPAIASWEFRRKVDGLRRLAFYPLRRPGKTLTEAWRVNTSYHHSAKTVKALEGRPPSTLMEKSSWVRLHDLSKSTQQEGMIQILEPGLLILRIQDLSHWVSTQRLEQWLLSAALTSLQGSPDRTPLGNLPITLA